MDKIWYRNPSKSEVDISRCGGDEKTNDHAEPTKVNAKFKNKKIATLKYKTNKNTKKQQRLVRLHL